MMAIYNGQFNARNIYITKFMEVTSTLTQVTVKSIKLCIAMFSIHAIALAFNLIFCLSHSYMYMIYAPILVYAIITVWLVYRCIKPNEISQMTRAISGDAHTGVNVNEEKIDSVVEKTYKIIGQLHLLNSVITVNILLLIIGEGVIWLFRFIL